MKDANQGRRAFLRRIFAGAGAIAIAGPAVLEELDRFDPRRRTYVDMGRQPKLEDMRSVWLNGHRWGWAPSPGMIANLDKIVLAYAMFHEVDLSSKDGNLADAVRSAIDKLDVAAGTVLAATGDR